MFYAATILVVFLSSGNVESYQRVSQTHSTRKGNNFRLPGKVTFQIKSQSTPLKELQRLTPRTIGIEVKRAVGLFMAFSAKKKMIAVARPFALVLLYLLFGSAFPLIQPNRLLSSLGSFLKSFRKLDQNVPALTSSLATKKTEDAAPERIPPVEQPRFQEATRILSEAVIAQARKDVEAQLLLIIDAENRVKLMRLQSEELSNLPITLIANPSSISDVAPAPIIAAIDTEAVIISTQEEYPEIVFGLVDEMPDLPPIGIKVSDEISYPATTEIIPTGSTIYIDEPKKNADVLLASLLIFAVGSPILQLIHQFTSTF